MFKSADHHLKLVALLLLLLVGQSRPHIVGWGILIFTHCLLVDVSLHNVKHRLTACSWSADTFKKSSHT